MAKHTTNTVRIDRHHPRVSDLDARKVLASHASPAPACAPEFDAAEFQNLRQRYFEEHRPEGRTELDLFETFVFARFQFNRVIKLEMTLQVSTDPAAFAQLIALARYRSSLERTFERAYKTFRELQTERYTREAPYARPTNDLPPGIKSRSLRRQRMEYAFDHQLDPHQPEVWPYHEFPPTVPKTAEYCTSTVEYPPKTVYERESPFPKPTIRELEKQLKEEQGQGEKEEKKDFTVRQILGPNPIDLP